MTIRSLATAAITIAVLASPQTGRSQEGATPSAAPPPVTAPSGYRSWNHVKTMVIIPGHPMSGAFAGMHNIYVNDVGLSASKSGGTYPDGSILVFDLFDSQLKDNAFVEGPRKFTAVMVKGAKPYAKTGGWGFEVFKPGDPGKGVLKDPNKECFSCHAAQKSSDYVFSRWGGELK